MHLSPDITGLRMFYRKKILQLGLSSLPGRSTFCRWIAEGHRFIYLASGGSFYLLILIAAMDLRADSARLPGQLTWDIGKMLRQPSTCSK